MDKEKGQLVSKMGELEKMCQSNNREYAHKNEFDNLINFVEDFKTTFSKNNLMKLCESSNQEDLFQKLNPILDSYKQYLGNSRVS